MEMHQLRYLIAVARTGSFSRAAEQCHVTQPSLSQQIQKLEAELGERLFDRMHREVRLTATGRALMSRALRILEEVDGVFRDVHDTREILQGTLTLGVLPTIAPYMLPEVAGRFARAFPKVDMVVMEDTTDALLRLGLGHEIDLALVSDPIRDARFEVKALLTEELLLALPTGHRLASRKTVAASELDQERLIVMREGHCLGEQVLGFCDRRSLRPQISFRSAQIETVQALVRGGLGVSLIPAMAAGQGRATGLVYRSLSPVPRRVINAIWPRQRPLSRTAQEFVKALEAGCRR